MFLFRFLFFSLFMRSSTLFHYVGGFRGPFDTLPLSKYVKGPFNPPHIHPNLYSTFSSLCLLLSHNFDLLERTIYGYRSRRPLNPHCIKTLYCASLFYPNCSSTRFHSICRWFWGQLSTASVTHTWYAYICLWFCPLNSRHYTTFFFLFPLVSLKFHAHSFHAHSTPIYPYTHITRPLYGGGDCHAVFFFSALLTNTQIH
ncbi:hypothetical protein K435DRAFT_452450 [Dendrothele bispora CBS 962.96]|uniref:Secreted protein n=1 Tax=Dendrothele bispora (strain CBS 962.96) TaxID=1314807 RepID=A0A4S8MU38_DENBC|nr:hypothetical protein K435DRAFT_452450 [Dendrothele bispora CBS 962.96]